MGGACQGDGGPPDIVAQQIESQQLRHAWYGREQLGALEPVAEARVEAVLGLELAHHDHALPVRDRHQDRAAALLAELAESLGGLVLLVGREVARPQHEAALVAPPSVIHGREHAVDLALQAAALGRPVAQEDARFGPVARRMGERQVEGGNVLAHARMPHHHVQGLRPFLPGQSESRRQRVAQRLVVARDLGLGLGHEAVPVLAELDGRGIACPVLRAAAEPQSGGERGDEARLGGRRLLGRLALLLAHALLRQLQDAPRGETAELLEELLAEIERGIAAIAALVLLQAPGDDEPRLLGRARLDERHRPRLLDAVDVGLRQHLAHLAVELGQARDQHDGGGHPVGDLDEVARRLLEALGVVSEEAQVLDLVDGEHQRRAVHRPHEPADGLDDVEGAALAGVGIERGNRLVRQLAQLLSVKVLPHALVDARVGALHVEERAHHVHVEVLAGEPRRRHDLVGDIEHQLGEGGVAQLGVAQLVDLGGLDSLGVAHHALGEPGERTLAAAVRIVRLLQRGDQPAQVVVGVVGHVGRHLGVAEVGLAAAMRARAQRADQVGLAGARLTMEQQNAGLHRGPVRGGDSIEQLGEPAARVGVHQLHIDGVGPPDVVLPGDGVLEGRGQAIGKRRNMSLVAHETSVQSGTERYGPQHHASTRMKWNTAFR
jgi:hypothetical protein